jgi:FkbM family methyltransferase
MGFLKNRRLDLSLLLNQTKFKVPIVDQIGFNNHNMDEFWMLDLFKKMSFDPEDIFIDVGANVGQTLLKWKSVFPDSVYFGFEPLPRCVQYLKHLAEINHFNKTHIVSKALFDTSEKTMLNLHFDDQTDRSASLMSNQLPVQQSIAIESITFEDFLNQNNVTANKIKLVKIDVEGAELSILNNIKDFLIKFQPLVIIEILSDPNCESGRLEQISDCINSIPYKWYRIKKCKFNFESLELIHKVDQNTSIENSDYLLIPKNKSTNFAYKKSS